MSRTHNVTPEIIEIWLKILAACTQWHTLAICPIINEIGQRKRQTKSKILASFTMKSMIAIRIPIVRIASFFNVLEQRINNSTIKSSNIIDYFSIFMIDIM